MFFLFPSFLLTLHIQNHLIKVDYDFDEASSSVILKSYTRQIFVGQHVLANSFVHTSNTRQIATYANSQRGVRGAMAHTESCRFRLPFFYGFRRRNNKKRWRKQKGLGKTIHSRKSFPWRVQYARARASRRE